ncbi:MAG: response regulator [Thermodesulfovibrio sp.]|uniref:sigma-54-dependent transcriptional regulator n=1 Tax=unclassified Thermodesulfovibrio TaxID=2645936 RepID=UPI00083B1C46|nr:MULTISPECIES: response regulator [unclassified Thermodesulfovibrio]MDI1472242.1 response regulator [Thermodesulfovibrio sp. 1176]MDI6714104.1 response regulator [Thermodesulfovibrio sp.]ODA44622.1 Response regulator of zinc sigma-54-dependent two-component system [Thermodesulfovibrio sp. N1]
MKEKILIVDDEPDMLKLLSMIIREKTPYEVNTTNNPIEAVQLIKDNDFSLVITDLKMPGIDGLQILEEVKKKDEDIPVIIITAYGTIESAMEAMQKGGFDFITKPFKKEHILFTIEKAIKWLNLCKENKLLKEKIKSAG